MMPFRPFRLAAMSILSLFGWISLASASGSITRSEFLSAISDDEVRAHITEHFTLSAEGRAYRAGAHLPDAGERMAPFEITAEPTIAPGESVVLRLDTIPSRQVLILPCSESDHYSADCE